MPSDKPSRRLYYSEAELQALYEVWRELRSPGRRGRPEHLSQRVKFNEWLIGLTAEGAARAREALAEGVAAPISGTRGTMTKRPKQEEQQEKRGPGRPPPPVPKASKPLNLDVEVWAWLDESGNRSALANEVLRAAMIASRRRRK